MVVCDICNKEFDSRRAMCAHRRWHDLPEYKEFQENHRTKARNNATGKKHTEETKEKLRQINLGKKIPIETIEKMRRSNTGKKRSEQARKNISEGRKGIVFSEEHKKNLSKSGKGKRKGESNPNWKPNVKYGGLHYRMTINKPKPQRCEICNDIKDFYGKTELELSNISGEYKDDINDFQWAHRSCHRKYDLENKISRTID